MTLDHVKLESVQSSGLHISDILVTDYRPALDRLVMRSEELPRSLSPHPGMICNRVRSIRGDILPIQQFNHLHFTRT